MVEGTRVRTTQTETSDSFENTYNHSCDIFGKKKPNKKLNVNSLSVIFNKTCPRSLYIYIYIYIYIGYERKYGIIIKTLFLV